MMIGNWLYALLCVVLPVAWGLLMVAVIGKIEQYLRKHQQQNPENSSPVDATIIASPDYHI